MFNNNYNLLFFLLAYNFSKKTAVARGGKKKSKYITVIFVYVKRHVISSLQYYKCLAQGNVVRGPHIEVSHFTIQKRARVLDSKKLSRKVRLSYTRDSADYLTISNVHISLHAHIYTFIAERLY